MKKQQLLTTGEMAQFTAQGFLRFDAIVPDEINQLFLENIGDPGNQHRSRSANVQRIMQSSTVPLVEPGTSLGKAYPKDSAIARLLSLPRVAGAIESLVGSDCVVDHHYLHLTFPASELGDTADARRAQPNHQDSTIDPRQAFDIQLFYFPHEVTAEMGGTRFIPGTHFRVVSEFAIARYQNILGQQRMVCPAGTVAIFHMGLWHGAGLNQSDKQRRMFKIRMCPTKPQVRLWDTGAALKQEGRPIFWTDGVRDEEHLYTLLTKPEPWFEADTGRLEYINRIRFWRYLSGDSSFDADYWVTRIENEYA